MNREVQILPDAAAIARRAAEHIVESAAAAVKERGVFTISLAGGSTPKTLYTLLATDPAFKSKMPWDKTQFFFGDERHVPPDDSESNFRMANESMLSKLSLKPEQVLRIKGGIRGRGKGRQGIRADFALVVQTLRRPTPALRRFASRHGR